MLPEVRTIGYLTALLTICFAGRVSSCSAAEVDDPLSGLRKEHPRLIWNAKRIAEVKQAIQQDPLARDWAARVKSSADKMLTQPPVQYVLIGPRLLDKSRTALERITTLAGMYQLTGDKRYADRARAEMLDVSAFADWHPPHFLDTAEMTNAVGLGYDWLYDYLSPADRETFRKAIIEKGLTPGLKIYTSGKGWATVTHNWNLVCNGGMTVGALAIADEEPKLAREIIGHVLRSAPRAMATYGPDGGWPEGPGYWGYATVYNAYMLSAMDTALGTEFNLDHAPGFSLTGNFRAQFIGPIGHTFDFADSHSGAGTSAQMLWLAGKFNQPDWDALERRLASKKPSIFHLVWFNTRFSVPATADEKNHLAPSQVFKGVDVCFLRTGPSRTGDSATFVGFKGGDNKANHSHLDLGTFVMDAMGQRWALHMGADNYNLPGYFGKQRYTYYRLSTEGQNTLTLDGKNQNTSAKAPIVKFDGSAEHPYAIADLSAAYPDARKVLRGIRLEPNGNVVIQDEIEANKPVEPVWNFHTDADVKVDGATATLAQGGKTLHARILRPAGAKFEVLSASPPPPQTPAPGTRNLIIRLSKGTQMTAVVVLSPGDTKPETTVLPLQNW